MNSMSGNSGDSHRDGLEIDMDDDSDSDGDGDDLEEAITSNGGDRNRFFDAPRGTERGSGRVYAAVEVPEPDDETAPPDSGEPSEPVFLECVDTEWFWPTQRSGKSWLEVYRAAPLSVLELTSYPLPPFPDGAQPGDVAWFEFGYDYSSGRDANARVYTSLYSPGAPVKVAFHEPRNWNWAGDGPMGGNGWLTAGMKQTSQDPASRGSAHLRRLLRKLKRSAGVAVYDVGQGNCQALLDEGRHVPLMYVDFGGGVLYNLKTFPKDFRGFCFTSQPLIALSHWDWDHWSSAYRFPRALDMEWVAPSVPHKPIQQAFAADLYARGRLHVWDSSWPSELRGGSMRIERCTGRTTNDSGLAVTLYSGALRSRNCLLPGDAGYKYIPSVAAAEKFSALCMSHHGGRLHSASYPLPKRNAIAVNSSGPRNSYKHPLFATLVSHLDARWPMPAQTGFSGQRPCHVFLPWGKEPHLFHGGCHGDMCSVAIAEIAPHCASISVLAHPTPSKAKAKTAMTLVSA